MGQKMVCFGALRGTRSRQDESIEVGEVGSKRPSLGGNGGHEMISLGGAGGLICALSGTGLCGCSSASNCGWVRGIWVRGDGAGASRPGAVTPRLARTPAETPGGSARVALLGLQRSARRANRAGMQPISNRQ
jgi:hypothetical protein